MMDGDIMYQLLSTGWVVRLSDGAMIPPAPGNPDLAEYEAWLAAGGVPESVPPPPEPFAAVSRRQILLALHQMDFMSAEELTAAAETGTLPPSLVALFAGLDDADLLAARVTWATMSEAHRDDPLVTMMINGGLATSEEADAVFRLAETL